MGIKSPAFSWLSLSVHSVEVLSAAYVHMTRYTSLDYEND